MFSPPSGYDDLVSDVEDFPVAGEFVEREVPKVGVVRLRKPRPSSAASLAFSASPDMGVADRSGHLIRCALEHADEGEVERIHVMMMDGQAPTDSVERVVRSVATWGTSRPYVAVLTLASITAYHWRTVRRTLVEAGVVNPLGLGSLHSLLDFAENLVVESAMNSDDPRRELESFYRRLYGPTPEALALNGDGYSAVPTGFSPDEVEASFDAFAVAAR